MLVHFSMQKLFLMAFLVGLLRENMQSKNCENCKALWFFALNLVEDFDEKYVVCRDPT